MRNFPAYPATTAKNFLSVAQDPPCKRNFAGYNLLTIKEQIPNLLQPIEGSSSPLCVAKQAEAGLL